MTATITITFGDQAENHVGMQKLGQMAPDGFSLNELKDAQKVFEALGCKCEFVLLNNNLPVGVTADEAAILVVRQGVDKILGTGGFGLHDIFTELCGLEWDTKAKMYGRVVNKHARHNLCFADIAQIPDVAVGKGRVIDFPSVPCTEHIRYNLPNYFGPKASNLFAEGNLYYDVSKCGIGYHGDSERRRVIAIRLGADMVLQYQWFLQCHSIGTPIRLMLQNGDLYIMSEKAVGTDFKVRKRPTLRHAAGAEKFLKIKPN